MILIIFSHAMPVNNTELIGCMNLNLATENIQNFLIILMRYGGQIGNAIFIISSAWFLIESTSYSKKKIVIMLLNSWFISVGMLLIFTSMGIRVDFKNIIKQLFPFTLNCNWFLNCYVLYYIIHPTLNVIISKLDRKEIFLTVSVLFIVYSCGATIKRDLFWNTSLTGFIMIHFLMAYIKQYVTIRRRKKLIITALLNGITLVGVLVVINLVGLKIPFLNDKMLMLCTFQNPLIVVMCISLFLAVSSYSSCHKKINYISSLTLLIYLFHANRIVLDKLIGIIFAEIYEHHTYSFVLFWVVIMGAGMSTISLVLASLYQKFTSKHIAAMTDNVLNILQKIFASIVRIMKI